MPVPISRIAKSGTDSPLKLGPKLAIGSSTPSSHRAPDSRLSMKFIRHLLRIRPAASPGLDYDTAPPKASVVGTRHGAGTRLVLYGCTAARLSAPTGANSKWEGRKLSLPRVARKVAGPIRPSRTSVRQTYSRSGA